MTPMDTDHTKSSNIIGLSDRCLSVSSVTSSLPVPNAPISVRLGTRDDIPFIDALQKQYSKALGFFPRAQLEGYIDNGWVLIAVGETLASPADAPLPTIAQHAAAGEASLAPTERRLGYVASRDRYLKRDELGVIYQLCVSPSAQGGLIGASLIKAVFERSAYGCRLYCCWCAQDLAANRFWESLGFQAIAFRGGSERKRVSGAGVAGRTHIFWQKRIRSADASTPWWFPAKTEGGALREDRIVLPIPPGLRWNDPMPVMKVTESAPVPVPQVVSTTSVSRRRRAQVGLPAGGTQKKRPSMRFGPPPDDDAIVEEAPIAVERAKPKREKIKCDPKLIAAARELRDRALEHINAEPFATLAGKYDVNRALASDLLIEVGAKRLTPQQDRLLPAA